MKGRCSLTMKQNVLARAEADSWLLAKVMSGQEVNSSLFRFFSVLFFFSLLMTLLAFLFLFERKLGFLLLNLVIYD